MAKPTHYETLGVSPAASLDEIKKRYRELARKVHPDVDQTIEADARFRMINEAYRILSDVEQRMFYDAELKLAAARKAQESAKAKPKPAPDSARTEPQPQRGGSWQSAGKSARKPDTGPQEKKSPVDVYLAQARSAMRKLRLREAESFCRQALRLDRRNVAAYEMLGDIHRMRGDKDQAVAMYSYALQLDRNRPGLREKFDRLVGQPSGPTMAGRAATASRRSSSASVMPPAERKLAATRAVINGVGFLLVACMLALVALSEDALARTPFYLEWDPILLLALASSGWMCGFVLAVNRRVGRFFDVMTGVEQDTRAGIGAPVAAVTLVVSMLSVYAGFAVYMVLGSLRKYVSSSLLCAFGASIAIAAFFTMVAQSSAIYVFISGGSIVFLSHLLGWLLGDLFR